MDKRRALEPHGYPHGRRIRFPYPGCENTYPPPVLPPLNPVLLAGIDGRLAIFRRIKKRTFLFVDKRFARSIDKKIYLYKNTNRSHLGK